MERLDVLRVGSTDEPGRLTRALLRTRIAARLTRSSAGARKPGSGRASTPPETSSPLRGQARGRAGADAGLTHRHRARRRALRWKHGASPRSPLSRRRARAASGSTTRSKSWPSAMRKAFAFGQRSTGSRALAGTYPPEALRPEGRGRRRNARGAQGVRRRSERAHAIRRDNVAAFVEAHIEQDRCWRPKACRSGSSRPSTAQPGSRSAWTAWPDMRERRRCACAATR